MRAGSGLCATVALLGLMAATGAAAADLSREKARLLSMGLLSSGGSDALVAGGSGMPAVVPRDAYVSLPGPTPQPIADDRMAGLGLLQRLALLFAPAGDLEPRPVPVPVPVPVAYAPVAPTGLTPSPIELIPYSGPIAAGTVVINMTQLQIFRIREGGWAERYQAETQDQLFSMVGSLR